MMRTPSRRASERICSAASSAASSTCAIRSPTWPYSRRGSPLPVSNDALSTSDTGFYPFARGRRREPLHPTPKTSTCGQNPRRMPHLRLIEVGEATGELKRQYDAAVQRAGKVFNIVKSMSLRPGVLERSMELYRAIMFGPSDLSRAERELLAVVVSRANDCHY